MKRLLLLILLMPNVASAQNMPANLTFSFPAITLQSGGTLANADSAGTWALMRLTPSAMTVAVTGTFTVAGTGTLAGQYYGSASLNSSSFSIGTDGFAVVGYSTIGSVPTASIIWKGRVLPVEIVVGEPLVYGGGGSIATATNILQLNGGTPTILGGGAGTLLTTAAIFTDLNFSTTAFDTQHTFGNATTTLNGTLTLNNTLAVNVTQANGTNLISSQGYLGINWGQILNPTSTVGLTGTTVGTVSTAGGVDLTTVNAKLDQIIKAQTQGR